MPSVDEFLDAPATADSFLDADSADAFLDADQQGTMKASGNALAQEAVKGVGHVLQGAAAAGEISGEYLGQFSPETGEANPFMPPAVMRTPPQTLRAVQANPVFQKGKEIADIAPETYPVDAARQGQFIPKAAGMVGGFMPLVASGPLAPVTIGVQSLGAHIDEDWTAAKAEGASDDVAARRAINRGLASGGLQSTIFLVLPKPLRQAGEKYLVEKFGTSAVKEFLAGRVALGAEGALLGATSTMAENVASARPLTEGVGSGAAGLGAFNLVLPPYFRTRGRNRAADMIEGELGGGASVPARPSGGPVIIPPERQLRAPAIELPGEGGLKNQSVLESIAELDTLLRDLPEPERAPRLTTEQAEAGLREVLPMDATTDIRVPPRDISPVAASRPLVAEPSPSALDYGAGGEMPEFRNRMSEVGSRIPRNQSPAAPVAGNKPKTQNVPVTNTGSNGGKAPEMPAAVGATPPGNNLFTKGQVVEHDGVQKTITRVSPDGQRVVFGNRSVPVSEVKPVTPPEVSTPDQLMAGATVQRTGKDMRVRLANGETNLVPGTSSKTHALAETLSYLKLREAAGKPAPASTPETPAAAVAKVQEHVAEVASGKKAVKVEDGGSKMAGPRPAKEIKSELVQRLEDKIGKVMNEDSSASAPVQKNVAGDRWAFNNEIADVIRTKDGRWEVKTFISKLKEKFDTEAEAEWFVKAAGSNTTGKTTVEIPGDGTFTIWNDGPKLLEVWQRAKRINTSSGKEPNVRQTGAPATVDKVIAAFGGADKAYTTAMRQIRALEDPAARAEAEGFAEAIYEKTTPAADAKWAENARDVQFTIERDIAGNEKAIARIDKLKRQTSQHKYDLAKYRKELSDNQKRLAEATAKAEKLEQEAAKSKARLAGEESRAVTSAATPDVLAKAQSAVEGRIDEIKREGRLRAFGDPELAMLRAAQGAIYVIKGAKNFVEWADQMRKRFGREIEPHLKDLWEQAKLIAKGEHPTIGLSEHGVKTIANEELSASVREAVNVHYAKLTDANAKTIAAARIAEVGGPMPAVAKMMAGEFDGEPGKVQNAIAANVMRALNYQEKAARGRGADQQADAIADAQVQVAQRAIDKSPDAGQTLQSFKLFYEQFSPAAWLMKFKRDVGKVAVERTEAATGVTVEPSPSGVASAIADTVAEQVGKTNPKLGEVIGDMFGTKNPEARSRIETLPDHLERTGKAAQGKGKAMADKISQFYKEEVAKFRKLHRIPEFDPATQRDILQRAKGIDALPLDSVQRRQAALELMNHLRRLKGFDWWELPLDFWYANILSGPTTHLKNISGNSASLGAEVALQIMRSPAALPSILEALGRALPRSATEAANILRTGHDTAARHAGKFETHGALDAVGGTAGKLLLPWKLVGRALKAADVMFFYPLQEVKGSRLASRESGLPVFGGRRAADVRRVMGWTEQAWAKAAAQATAEGLAGNLARRRTYELLEQARPETLMENARDFAFQGTFNNDPYGVLGAVQRGFERTAKDVPALKLIAPFTRIITNITNSGLNWTPVGAWRAARGQGLKLLIGRDGNTGKLYGKEITDPTAIGDAYTRATVGTLALGGLAMAAGQYVFDRNPQFMVTGSGPADPDQRKQLREAGWIPFSIKIGDRYYTYQDKTWAMPLAVVGHYLDALRYRKLDQQDALNRAAFALGSGFNVIVQSSWLQGLSAIFDQAGRDSVKNPLKALPQQALRTASSFVVPNALRQVDQLFDPTKYKANDIRAMMLAQLPFARRNNQPDLNVFGEPVQSPASKNFMSSVEGDGLTRMLADRRLWPSVPADPYLTPEQTYALMKYRGPQLREKLLENYADLATISHAEAQQLVATISRKVTVQAKKDLGLDTLSGIEKQVGRAMEQ